MAFNIGPSAPQLSKSLTSLVVDYGAVPRGESAKLLDSKVSLKVKDAAFLTILDSVLSSAGTSCRVECRGVKVMKLTLDLKDMKAGPLLDTLAKAGGVRLWVFPSKLVLAPENLLTVEEKKTAKLYGVLLSKENFPKGSGLDKVIQGVDILGVANTIISKDFNNTSWGDSFDGFAPIVRKPYDISAYPSQSARQGLAGPATLSASLQDMSFGDVLAFVAHSNGCELFLLPGSFLICDPNNIPANVKDQAVSAFSPASTKFNFGSNGSLDPSAKGS
ncbi:hypothetical protein EON83_29535 [bacterium]|nr:MAG: hypothetical protein EON83_29535 [bacterium]